MKSFYFILINRTKLIWTHIFSKIEFFKLNIGTSCTQIHMFHRRTVVNFKWKVLCLLFLARFSYFFICLSCHISHGSTIDRWQKYLSVLLRTVLLKKKKKQSQTDQRCVQISQARLFMNQCQNSNKINPCRKEQISTVKIPLHSTNILDPASTCRYGTFNMYTNKTFECTDTICYWKFSKTPVTKKFWVVQFNSSENLLWKLYPKIQ